MRQKIMYFQFICTKMFLIIGGKNKLKKMYKFINGAQTTKNSQLMIKIITVFIFF